MSIFVEVGWDEARQCAKDSFVFDCGAGVVGNYGAMEVGYRRMDKVFITLHIRPDHPQAPGRALELDLLRFVPLEEWVLKMERVAGKA